MLKTWTRIRKIWNQEVAKCNPNNTNVNKTELNNVNNNAIKNKDRRSPEKESLAKEIARQLNDDHSLGLYRKVVDTIPENLIFQTLSEVKDAFLTGKVKKAKELYLIA